MTTTPTTHMHSVTMSHAGGSLHHRPPGEVPAVVAMHVFPDDHHICDRLIRISMAAGRYLDWLGGRSDRPPAGASTRRPPARTALDQLELHDAVLVGHDASAPEALDLALTQPDRAGAVVLFNTYYGHDRALHLPEFMAVMADPNRPVRSP